MHSISYKYKKILIMLLVVALAELFLFNSRTYDSMENTSIPLSEIKNFEIQNGKMNGQGDIVLEPDTDYVCLILDVPGKRINNLKLDVCCVDSQGNPVNDIPCNVELYLEENVLLGGKNPDGSGLFEWHVTGSTVKNVFHGIESSYYLRTESTGETRSCVLFLSDPSENYDTFRIYDLELNAFRPLFISPLRIVCIFAVVLIFYFLFFDEQMRKCETLKLSKSGKIILLSVFVIFSVFAFVWPTLNHLVMKDDYAPYAMLARSFLEGRTSVGGPVPDYISASEGQPVYWRYDDAKIDMYDYSFHGGKYYVYFGVLPCVLFYIPYLLLTGHDMPNAYAVSALCVIAVALIYFMLKAVIAKWYRHASFQVHILLTAVFAVGMYLPVYITGPEHYQVPILAACDLIFAGIIFVIKFEENNKRTYLTLVLGSLCLALVSFCRPAMLIFSLLIMCIPTGMVLSNIKGCDTKKTIIEGLCMAVPFIVCASICMLYNYVRFGSVLEFGFENNLTSIPVGAADTFMPYAIYKCIYEYLIKPPTLDPSFPFIAAERAHFCENGVEFVVSKISGGLIGMFPCVLAIPFMSVYKEKLKSKHLFIQLLILMASGLGIMLFSAIYSQYITNRYVAEFSWTLFLPAAVVLLEMEESSRKSDGKESRIFYNALTAVLLVSLIFGLFMFCGGGNTKFLLEKGNPQLWYNIRSMFDAFG